jgi:hypothetical protein
LPQLLLGPLTVVDVGKKEIPGGYLIFRISYWEAADLEPSVYAVGTPTTVLYS